MHNATNHLKIIMHNTSLLDVQISFLFIPKIWSIFYKETHEFNFVLPDALDN